MNFIENILNSLATIWSNKLRSGLTMLGIVIGVSSVVVMIAIGQGAQASVTSRLEELGTNVLTVSGGGSSNVRNMMRGGGSGSLKNSDYDILANLEDVTAVLPLSSGNEQIIYGDENTSASIYGVTPEYFSAKNKTLLLGNYFTIGDNDKRERKIVVDEEVLSNLSMTDSQIGEKIRIGDALYTIVAVIEGDDGIIYTPLATAQLRIFGVKTLNGITIMVKEAEMMDTVEARIMSILLAKHKISNEDNADFSISNQAEMLETMNEITQIFTILLGGIAGISLIVGGIGVMNIMLVSVTERTREIGIRKAVGAHRNDILLQFLTESVILSVFAGIIGVGISFVATGAIKKIFEFDASVSVGSILLAFTFSAAVGIIFGLLPAYKASKLKPIDALRYE